MFPFGMCRSQPREHSGKYLLVYYYPYNDFVNDSLAMRQTSASRSPLCPPHPNTVSQYFRQTSVTSAPQLDRKAELGEPILFQQCLHRAVTLERLHPLEDRIADFLVVFPYNGTDDQIGEDRESEFE